MAAGRVQFAVTSVQSGRTVYVRVDAKLKNTGGGKRYLPVSLDLATHVFISEKGYGTPRLGTYYPPREGYTAGRFFTDRLMNDPHMWAITQIVNLVNGAPTNPQCTIESENICGLCGHRLTDPVSIQRGIGPDCAQKATGTQILHASPFSGEQQTLDVDAENVRAEQIRDNYKAAFAAREREQEQAAFMAEVA